ncbi:MAG: hypothetical protein LQ347_001750 [Umbilicaria vellea]|nr:MAG: hypothetical protein LQ347_001750 [Umbilicaria vellea]
MNVVPGSILQKFLPSAHSPIGVASQQQWALRILIDTGEGLPAWSSLLARVLSSENTTIAQAILTHWHPDHISGVNDLQRICPKVQIFKNSAHDTGTAYSDIHHGQIFQTQAASLRAFHCPGHTTDHTALILEEENAMFTGDNVLGHGTAVFEDLPAYLGSLETMQHQFSGRAYPGHGAVIADGKAKIQEYIRHRQQREAEIFHALRPGGADSTATHPANGQQAAPAAAWSPMQLVKVVYKDVPESLHEPAARGVVQVLRKLQGEGRVVQMQDQRWRVAGKAAL